MIAFLRRLLGIRSPSRETSATARVAVYAFREGLARAMVPGVEPTWYPPCPRLWYAARTNWDPLWETPELRRAARIERRRRRRAMTSVSSL